MNTAQNKGVVDADQFSYDLDALDIFSLSDVMLKLKLI